MGILIDILVGAGTDIIGAGTEGCTGMGMGFTDIDMGI
jgi:hypothetical protein